MKIAAALLVALALMLLSTGASAECAWVLWVEAPVGSDQWSIASVPQTRFTVSKDCQRFADDLNVFELTMRKMHGASADARDEFSCLPCTVDPRPEGALLHEGATPRGPKGQ